jgi:hypothetical protein
MAQLTGRINFTNPPILFIQLIIIFVVDKDSYKFSSITACNDLFSVTSCNYYRLLFGGIKVFAVFCFFIRAVLMLPFPE